jgi:hypothetical protein
VYKILASKLERNGSLGRDDKMIEKIKICLKEIGCEDVDWNYLPEGKDC